MKTAEQEEPTPPRRPRVRFALRHLLGLITIGCLLGGLCLWPHWWFEERVLLLAWGISLALGEYAARRFGRTIRWPLLGSVISTAIAYFVLRSTDDHWDGNGRWTWSEYAWNVWRLWAVLLVAAMFASLVVLWTVRALPRVPAAARTFAIRLRSSRRLRWLAISISAAGVVAFALYWSLAAAARWSPHRAVRWHGPLLPQVLFCSDQREFLTVDDAGRVTLWDWNSARALSTFRAEVPKSGDAPSFQPAVLSGNRLALASSNRDFVTVYRLPNWKPESQLSHEEIRNHSISSLYSLKDGKQLVIVYRPPDERFMCFSFWDNVNRQWLQHVAYEDGGSAVMSGISSSGRYGGVVKRLNLDRSRLTIIDFETQSVILDREYGPGFGPVIFFNQDRKIGHVTQVFDLDGKGEQELPGVIFDSIAGTNRLVLVEFQSLLPNTLNQLIENVPIVGHLCYLGRVRLAITRPANAELESRSCWFYGYGTTINAVLSSDGQRLVWADSQGRLLLWNLPTTSTASR